MALLAKPAEQFQNEFARMGIEIPGRLIRKYNLGLDQASGDATLCCCPPEAGMADVCFDFPNPLISALQ
jgi:hypothetical protein